MLGRRKRVGTKTTHDEQFVYLVFVEGWDRTIGMRVLADERSVTELRRETGTHVLSVRRTSVDTIRPWYHDGHQ
jgi:hypothetical protein